MDFLRHALVVARKDLLIEFRSRERIVSMMTFAILVAVVFTFALDPVVRPLDIAGAMLWVTIIFAGMLGLGRSFSLEREQDALIGLLLTPVSRGAIYLGKFAANLVLLVAAAVAVFLVYALFFGLDIVSGAGGIALVTLLACVGFMALGTLFSAMAAGTRMGDTLLPIVLLPLLIPVVFFGAGATQRLLIGRPLSEVLGSIRLLAAFDIIFLVVCTLLFAAVVEE